ncbi:serine/arginine repetitive matrix protein 2-like [Drosophila rhopaloa]|uniref:RRM domain-containing protein n=1 Tax=Drosophila rhopaloa TaxID=1041015 RepID=A0ABM5JBQ2_DRORH|nr:serine/arginine repetitive matrix protein 2-like [Drosophila rhopaloa]
MPKEKDGVEPPTKRQRKDRRGRKDGKEVIPAGGGRGAGPSVRNSSPTPSIATESSDWGDSESSYSDSSFSSTASSRFSSSTSSTSSSSSSSESNEEPEGSTKKPSCCRHRHYHRHRRHHHPSRHSHRRRGRGSRHHRSAHGRSTKRSSRKGRRGASSTAKAPLVIKEESPSTQAILIPDPIPLPVPAPIPAVLATHPHPQPHPQPVPAPALAPAPVPAPGHTHAPVAKPAPQAVPMEHHHRKTRVRSSGSGLQNLIPATSSHSQGVFQSRTVTVTKSTATPTTAPTPITMPSDGQSMGNSSEGKIKVGGARSSSTKIPLANAMASKSANQVKTPEASSSSKALAKPVNPSSRHFNVKPRTLSKNPETSKIGTSNNERPRRGPSTPKRQWDDERSDGCKWKQRRNREGGGGATREDPFDDPDAEGSQVAYRNGKPTFRFRQPARIVRLHIKGLTRQVTKEHITEIFGHFGALTAVDFPMDRYQVRLGRGYAFVEYARPEDCACAIKHMNGGLIDGKRITVSAFQESMLKAPWRDYRRYSPVNRRQRRHSPSRSRSSSRSLPRFLSRSRSPSFSRSRSRTRSRSSSRSQCKSGSRYNRRYRTPSRSPFSRGRSHYHRHASRSP